VVAGRLTRGLDLLTYRLSPKHGPGATLTREPAVAYSACARRAQGFLILNRTACGSGTRLFLLVKCIGAPTAVVLFGAVGTTFHVEQFAKPLSRRNMLRLCGALMTCGRMPRLPKQRRGPLQQAILYSWFI
jgi:hypothetical protein